MLTENFNQYVVTSVTQPSETTGVVRVVETTYLGVAYITSRWGGEPSIALGSGYLDSL
jgi:hypothetical protein